MKKFFIFTLLFISLASCSDNMFDEDGDLTTEGFMSSYKLEDRSVDLSESWLSGFVSLNGLNGDTEIVNIYLSNNEIEVLNITDFLDLWRLVINNNNITYFWDIKYPSDIRHIDLSYNNLENLDGIEKLQSLKTLDLSYNKLDEDDLEILSKLPNLKAVYIIWNDVSDELIEETQRFSAAYLRSIKQ